MPGLHSKLSPSAAERWLSCPASIRVEEELKAKGFRDEDSIYAREGTAAHALGELKARHKILKEMDDASYELWHSEWYNGFADVLDTDWCDVDEMEEYTQQYVDLIVERMDLYPGSKLFLEQRLDTGVPTCWGTSDTVIVSPFHVEIIDFKYGSGVYVQVFGNPQTRLYALGALDSFRLLYDIQLVRITIHQPRMNNIATEELSPDELWAWREEILPIAASALEPGAPFGPSDEACNWCPASGKCKAQMEFVFREDFDAAPDDLSPEEIADIIPKIPLIKKFLTKFEEAALNTAYSEGKEIPGYKVVMSGGKRSVVDPEGAIRILEGKGFDRDQFGKQGEFVLGGIGVLEKLLKKEFKPLLEDSGLVRKGEGRPSLVPASDKRPSVNPNSGAVKDFGEDMI